MAYVAQFWIDTFTPKRFNFDVPLIIILLLAAWDQGKGHCFFERPNQHTFFPDEGDADIGLRPVGDPSRKKIEQVLGQGLGQARVDMAGRVNRDPEENIWDISCALIAYRIQRYKAWLVHPKWTE